MRYLLLIISLVISMKSYSQLEYKLKRLNRSTIISIDRNNSETIDTLSIPKKCLSKKHCYVKIIDKNIFLSSFYYIPPIASFNSSFIMIDVWTIKDGYFESSHNVKIIRKGCDLNKTTFKLVENGIEWRVGRGLFRKKLKGFIPFNDNSGSEEYIIKCVE